MSFISIFGYIALFCSKRVLI